MKLVSKKINGLEIRKSINHTDNEQYTMQVCNVYLNGKLVGDAYCYYMKDMKKRIMMYSSNVEKIRNSAVLARETIKSFNYPNLLPSSTAFTPSYKRR